MRGRCVMQSTCRGGPIAPLAGLGALDRERGPLESELLQLPADLALEPVAARAARFDETVDPRSQLLDARAQRQLPRVERTPRFGVERLRPRLQGLPQRQESVVVRPVLPLQAVDRVEPRLEALERERFFERLRFGVFEGSRHLAQRIEEALRLL